MINSKLNPGCWQCDLDIGHVCYAGDPRASWGMNDHAVATLDAANRYLTAGGTRGAVRRDDKSNARAAPVRVRAVKKPRARR